MALKLYLNYKEQEEAENALVGLDSGNYLRYDSTQAYGVFDIEIDFIAGGVIDGQIIYGVGGYYYIRVDATKIQFNYGGAAVDLFQIPNTLITTTGRVKITIKRNETLNQYFTGAADAFALYIDDVLIDDSTATYGSNPTAADSNLTNSLTSSLYCTENIALYDYPETYTTEYGEFEVQEIAGESTILKEADLFPDEGITLKQKGINATGGLNSTMEFTKEFTIPATDRNNALLGHYESKAVVSTVNPNKKINARIEIDVAKVYYGSVELLSVTWKGGVPYTYTIVFYGSASGLKVDLGSTKLVDIDWSSFAMTMTADNVVATWDTNASTYVPIISWVRPYRYYEVSSSPANVNDITVNGVLLDELRVGIRLLDFVTNIFTHVGAYPIFYPKINSFLQSAYIIPSDTKEITRSQVPYDVDVEGDNLTCAFGVRNNLVLPTVNSDVSGSWTDPNYTAQFSGTHIFKIDITTTVSTGLKEFYVVDSTTGIDVPNAFAALGNDSGSVFLSANLIEGDTYKFQSEKSISGTSITYEARLTTFKIPVTILNKVYDPSDYMPDMLASEFLSEFLKTFNLDMIEVGSNGYVINDIASIFDYSDLLDLNEYVDQNLLTYEKLDVYKEITFSHQEGKDIGNINYSNVNITEYGQYKTEPDYDFASETLEVESVFNVFPPNYIFTYDTTGDLIGYTDLLHHYQLDDSEEPKPVLSNFLLMYRNDSITTAYPYKMQSGVDAVGDPTYTNYTVYPHYSQVQANISTATTNTFSFKVEDVPSGVKAEETIYKVFWDELTTQIYDNAAYKIDVSFQASFGVYYKLSKTALCYFKGFYHYISEFQYNTANSMITLKLVKLKASPNLFISAETFNLITEDSDPIITEDSNNIIV